MFSSWTTGTAALALLLYVVSLINRICTRDGSRRTLVIEVAAWMMLVIHIGFAFHEHHGWSHAAAERHVADDTAATVGIRWGGGIYFNHAMVVLWGVSIVHRGLARQPSSRLAGRLQRLIDIYVALMWASATILFGSTGFRWLGIAGFSGLGWALWLAKRRSKHEFLKKRASTRH
jgi:hypothetical protein